MVFLFRIDHKSHLCAQQRKPLHFLIELDFRSARPVACVHEVGDRDVFGYEVSQSVDPSLAVRGKYGDSALALRGP